MRICSFPGKLNNYHESNKCYDDLNSFHAGTDRERLPMDLALSVHRFFGSKLRRKFCRFAPVNRDLEYPVTLFNDDRFSQTFFGN